MGEMEVGASLWDQLVTLNAILVLLGAGLGVWLVRQIVPDKIEETKVWRVILRVLPVILGGLLALIPGLHPMGDTAQSVVVGAVVGGLSSNLYEVIREMFGERIKGWLGSPQARKRMNEEEE